MDNAPCRDIVIEIMPSLTTASMRSYLRRSVSSFNQNKLRGLIAEIALRNHLAEIGYVDRVSVGGWIFRNSRSDQFGRRAVVVFPEIIRADTSYNANRRLPELAHGLHAIGAVFHRSGIHAYYCAATIDQRNDPESVRWRSVQLGVPAQQPYLEFPDAIDGYTNRIRRFGFLRYNTRTTLIPAAAIPEEFSKENLRIAFVNRYFAEVSDIDGVFWGQQVTYPLEIKEKTAAHDPSIGEYFGLDIGPFAKLAFYAAKRGDLKSLFIVREIDNVESRNLRQWWFITFEELAQVASWVGLPGGTNMAGGRSAVVRIPKSQFQPLNAGTLAQL
jgi:hypothetical protein